MSASQSRSSKHRSWLLLPALLIGFLLLSGLLFGEKLRPRLDVQTAPALLLENRGSANETPAGASQILSQASGWIEPDPYPIRVPVRVDGLVDSVEVLEGERVKAGQLLATLDPVDFEFQLRALEASLLGAKTAQVEKEEAVKRAEAECHRALAGVDAARARLNEQEDRLRRVLALDAGVVPEDERLQVEREVAVGKAELAAAKAEWEGHKAHQAVELAGIESAKAKVVELQAKVARAKTDLERTKIYAPVDGVVMHRFANPGGKRMRGMDDPESATVVSMYDPQKLQVRVDVPLADAAGVTAGMPARIQLSAFSDREFKGTVTRIAGQADLTRNTLQVKVAIENPDPRMRPEMLCRVEFMSIPKLGKRGGETFRPSETVWVPREAVQGENLVWVVDPVSQRAASRTIELGAELRENYQAVRKGLRPGERVVLGQPSGLKNGVLVNEVNGESR
ncbi:efflux RND transporter periplasmic adaptor subunit [Kiritimatiellaeota bacterium B1221]|nr:efflux RND transporter periplasmic adaptor subunit [Kiritimatiellaeota bacterium B1221]